MPNVIVGILLVYILATVIYRRKSGAFVSALRDDIAGTGGKTGFGVWLLALGVVMYVGQQDKSLRPLVPLTMLGMAIKIGADHPELLTQINTVIKGIFK